MHYRNLGGSGLKVSEICLGTMTFGHTTDADEAGRIIDLACDGGVNFIDTANNYAGGQSEAIVGKALRGRRHDRVLATKCFNPSGTGPNDSGSSRLHILNAVEHSLKRLQTDYIDVYYLHHVDEQTPLEETLRALDDLVREGKVRYIACSNYEAWRLLEALWISDSKGWERFVCYQPQYSLVVRDIEEEILPVCRLKNVGVVPWGPLAGGFLTGKYRPNQRVVPGTRSEEGWVFMDKLFAPNADETLAELLRVAEQLGHQPAQVAMRWVLQQQSVSSVIVGARTAEQFQTNLATTETVVPDELLQQLEKISRLPMRYPKALERTMPARRAQAVKR